MFFGIEVHVPLDRNPGPGYNTIFLRLIPEYLNHACHYRRSTHHTAINKIGLHCQTPTLATLSVEAVCIISWS